METTCPCQSGIPYADCCGPYHRSERPSPTAETLMRSRYSAYALQLADYIVRTTHRDNAQARRNIKAWTRDIADYCKRTQFLGLEILDRQDLNETTATVTFRAELSQAGIVFHMIEKSTFLKIGARWLYHSGHTLPEN